MVGAASIIGCMVAVWMASAWDRVPEANTSTGKGERVDDLQEVIDVDRVVRRSEVVFGPRFGGAFIDGRGGHSILRVLIVRPLAGDRSRLASLSRSSRVKLAVAQFGAKEVDEIQERLTRIVIEAKIRPAMVWFDERAQRFVVEAQTIDPGTKAKLRAAAPRGAVRYDLSREFIVELL